jgi:hypothetical protein
VTNVIVETDAPTGYMWLELPCADFAYTPGSDGDSDAECLGDGIVRVYATEQGTSAKEGEGTWDTAIPHGYVVAAKEVGVIQPISGGVQNGELRVSTGVDMACDEVFRNIVVSTAYATELGEWATANYDSYEQTTQNPQEAKLYTWWASDDLSVAVIWRLRVLLKESV